jgi:RNA polymerase sigma-70 factor, ECF subfamily
MRNPPLRSSVGPVSTESLDLHQGQDPVDEVVAVATTVDELAFSELADRHWRELHAHCYRMLGSREESEDLVQETFLRAWRWRRSFRGGSSRRAWLYRIATNACLDALRRRPRRQRSAETPELARVLEGIRATDPEPDAVVVSRETIEVVLTHLPSKQRAVLVLRDVLGLSAKDSAALLATSTASVNSALQRARRNLRDRLPEQRLEWRAPTGGGE